MHLLLRRGGRHPTREAHPGRPCGALGTSGFRRRPTAALPVHSSVGRLPQLMAVRSTLCAPSSADGEARPRAPRRARQGPRLCVCAVRVRSPRGVPGGSHVLQRGGYRRNRLSASDVPGQEALQVRAWAMMRRVAPSATHQTDLINRLQVPAGLLPRADRRGPGGRRDPLRRAAR